MDYGYYSKLVNKPFDTLEELQEAEKKYKENLAAKEAAKAKKEEAQRLAAEEKQKKIAEREKQIEDLTEEINALYKKIDSLAKEAEKFECEREKLIFEKLSLSGSWVYEKPIKSDSDIIANYVKRILRNLY